MKMTLLLLSTITLLTTSAFCQSSDSCSKGFNTLLQSDDSKKGLKILNSLSANNRGFIITISSIAVTCTDEKDMITFTFEDGATASMPNTYEFNCKGMYSLYFGGVFKHKSELESLATKRIKTIKATSKGGPIEINLNAEQSNRLYQEISCLKSKMK